MLKIRRITAQCPVLPPKENILTVLAKTSGKIETEPFSQCAILHEN